MGWGFGGVVILAILLVSIFGHAAIARQLHTWKLLPEPERLTELYFTDHTKLPTTYTPGSAQTIAFTVHNLEYRTTHYTYTIQQISQDGTQKQALATGSFTLAQNALSKQTIPVTPADLGNGEISVSINTGESIDYLITREGV